MPERALFLLLTTVDLKAYEEEILSSSGLNM